MFLRTAPGQPRAAAAQRSDSEFSMALLPLGSFSLYFGNSSAAARASVCELPCSALLLPTSVWLVFWSILTLANQIQGGSFASGSHVVNMLSDI